MRKFNGSTNHNSEIYFVEERSSEEILNDQTPLEPNQNESLLSANSDFASSNF